MVETQRTVVTVSKSLHKTAALYAQRDGVSLEDLVISILAERVGRESVPQYIVVSTAGAPTIVTHWRW